LLLGGGGLLWWAGRGRPAGGAGAPPARTRQALLILPHLGFWWPDYEPVRRELEQGGYRVVVASFERGPARPKEQGGGEPVAVDVLLADARADDYDAVVCIGWNVIDLTRNTPGGESAAALLRAMLRDGKYVAGLCAGRGVLSDAGLLYKQRVSEGGLPPPGVQQAPGIIWAPERVVVSGHIITAAHPEDAVEFTRTLLRCLQ
jgi:protease I